MPGAKKQVDAALPVFSTDTVDEAGDLQQLFASLVSAGPLAGRYVVKAVNAVADDQDAAMAALHQTRRRMADAYGRMKNRKKVLT